LAVLYCYTDTHRAHISTVVIRPTHIGLQAVKCTTFTVTATTVHGADM